MWYNVYRQGAEFYRVEVAAATYLLYNGKKERKQKNQGGNLDFFANLL